MPATLPQIDDDLFKDSTMTFGEHLEELRQCLFRALVGLGIGVVIGLMIGSYVIELIKSPLSEALDNYKTTAAVKTVQQELEQRRAGGESIDDAYERELIAAIRKKRLAFDDVFIDRRALDAAIGRQEAASSGPASAALPSAANAANGSDRNNSDPPAESVQPPGATPSAEQPAADRNRSDAGNTADRATLADEEDATNREPAADRSAGSRLDAADLVKVRIWRPVGLDPSGRIIGDNVTEAFMVYLKASFVAGLVIASPWIFWQLWMFVAAGLYPHEKHYVYIFLPFSLGLFLFGASFAFFLVFKPVLNFLLSFNAWLGIDPYLRINAWLSFVLILPLGFGLSFQLPLVMLFLERIGVFDARAYKDNLRVAILAIAIISMLLTPSDPYSMVLMAVPLVFLYLGGILLCKYWPRRANPLDASYG